MNNYDRIKSMSVEEMAEEFAKSYPPYEVDLYGNVCVVSGVREDMFRHTLKMNTIKWLLQEVSEGLKRAQYLKKEIETLSEILDKIKSGSIVGAKSYRDKESTAKYSSNSKIEDRMDKVESLETEIENRIVELHILYRQILHWIFGIDDAFIRLIFEEKYLNCRTWNQVADIVGGANTEDSVKKIAYRYLERELIK